MLSTIKAHPWITACMVICAVAGVVLAFPFAPEDWGAARTVAAGLFAGFGTGLTIVATRMLGAFGE
jgi:hypothetical protein